MIVEKAPVLETVFRGWKCFLYSPLAPPSYTPHGKVTKIKPYLWQAVQRLGGSQSGTEQYEPR